MQHRTSYDPIIEKVIDQYYDMVYRLAYARTGNPYDAEDVLQEVFLRFIRRRSGFMNDEHEKAWFLRVTINCSKNLFAAFAKYPAIPLIENKWGFTDEEKILDEFIIRLPQKYRTVIHLFYYEDLKISEIADLLALKESTVKVQLSRARGLLKGYLELED